MRRTGKVFVGSDPDKDATTILQTVWGPESDDLIPVDPVQIARRLGIRVIEAALDANISGALVKKPGQDPTIVLNSKDSPNRKRFSCAHEIGHFVRRTDEPNQYEYVDLRDDIFSAAGTDQEEIYANQFAASLLMPKDEVRRIFRKNPNEVVLAWKFDVSREAMHYRLKNLGLIKIGD